LNGGPSVSICEQRQDRYPVQATAIVTYLPLALARLDIERAQNIDALLIQGKFLCSIVCLDASAMSDLLICGEKRIHEVAMQR